SADGRRLLTGGGFQFSEVRSVPDGEALRQFSTGPHTHTGAFSRNGRYVAVGGTDLFAKPHVLAWDLEGGKQLVAGHSVGRGVHCVAVSPDGRRVFSASAEQWRLWDVKKGATEDTQQLPAGCADFSPDGRRLVTGDRFGVLRLKDVEAGTAPRKFKGTHD